MFEKTACQKKFEKIVSYQKNNVRKKLNFNFLVKTFKGLLSFIFVTDNFFKI